MEQNFYEATKPALDLGKSVKEGNFFTRFLAKHPRLIIPFTGGAYVLFFATILTIVFFCNNGK